MGYNTKQREELISFFENNGGEGYTAAQIIGKRLVQASAATVFRNLNALSDEGILRKSAGSDGAVYQYAPDECKKHFHLQCTGCGRVEHMDCAFMHDFEKHISADHDFEIDNTKTVIYGLCKKCRGIKSEK